METIKRILHTLNDTHNIMLRATRRLVTRGIDTEITENKSMEILQTSELFMFKTIPWYERLYSRIKKKICICPLWWFCRTPATKQQDNAHNHFEADVERGIFRNKT